MPNPTLLLQDLRFALRQLRRAPGFALTAVLTLALGIGVNTAIFSLLDQALLRSLPVRDPGSLVILEGTGKAWSGHASSHGGDSEAYFSYPMYRDLRDRLAGFAGVVASAKTQTQITFGGSAHPAATEIVSGNYFTVLGTPLALGRVFTPSDDTAPSANPVLVLSHDYWRNSMGADPRIVGQTVGVNGHPFQVVGVVAPDFHSAIWGETPAFFVPMSMLGEAMPGEAKRLTDHTDKWLNILGRLAPGQTIASAQAAAQPLWHALRAEELKSLPIHDVHFTSDFVTNSRMRLVPGARGFSYQRDSLAKPLYVVMALAALVLLLAVVNVASLLLVRAAGRMREFSVRAALGASAGRVLTQLLLEGLLIGILGGACGLALAPLALRGLIATLTGDGSTTALSPTLDLRLLAFNFVVAIAVSLFFSLAPALQVRRSTLTSTLRESAGTVSGSMLSLRRVIVGLQVGLSVLLLFGSGLFIRSMRNLRNVPLGFNATSLLTFSIAPQLAGYTFDAIPALTRRSLEALAAMPGVEEVTASSTPQLGGDSSGGNITLEGYSPRPGEDTDTLRTFVRPNFFAAMRIPLVAGRTLAESDDATHPHVVVVNQAFAKRYFGSAQAAVGHRYVDGGPAKPVFDTEIVGVVRDFQQVDLRSKVDATAFAPFAQMKPLGGPNAVYFYQRSRLLPATAAAAARRVMQGIDPGLALDNLYAFEQQENQSLANERLIAVLSVSFGVLATLMAGVGLYGVLAYATLQRTREIGIRMALGSTRAAISSLIVRDVFRLAAAGVAVALPLALLLGWLVRSQLFGVSAVDPVVLAAVVGLIALVALCAALVPAIRAARTQPTVALRAE